MGGHIPVCTTIHLFHLKTVHQVFPLKRLMTVIILYVPWNLVLMRPNPPMYRPQLLHLSPFLPVTQQVSDSQPLFNFLMFSFPSLSSSTAWYVSLSLSCCCFTLSCFFPKSHLLPSLSIFLWSSMTWSPLLHIAHIHSLNVQTSILFPAMSLVLPHLQLHCVYFFIVGTKILYKPNKETQNWPHGDIQFLRNCFFLKKEQKKAPWGLFFPHLCAFFLVTLIFPLIPLLISHFSDINMSLQLLSSVSHTHQKTKQKKKKLLSHETNKKNKTPLFESLTTKQIGIKKREENKEYSHVHHMVTLRPWSRQEGNSLISVFVFSHFIYLFIIFICAVTTEKCRHKTRAHTHLNKWQ